MLFTNISTLLVVGSSVLLATAGVIAERKYAANEVAPLPGYALVEAVMSGTMLGQKFKLNGTAKEVYTKLEKIHGTAKLAAAVSKIENTAAGPLARRDGSVSTELDKRNKIWNPLCIPVAGWGWEKAHGDDIGEMLGTLRRVGGTSYVTAHSCAKIACYDEGETWLCNDRNDNIAPGNVYLASYGSDIVSKCRQALYGNYLAGGQMFDTDNYNVIMRKGGC